jgi:hypothetical protein
MSTQSFVWIFKEFPLSTFFCCFQKASSSLRGFVFGLVSQVEVLYVIYLVQNQDLHHPAVFRVAFGTRVVICIKTLILQVEEGSLQEGGRETRN